MQLDRKIYFLCPNETRPVGGIKVIYRHVDILNKNGFSAYVLHTKKGFKCTWFKNNSRIAYNTTLLKNIRNKGHKTSISKAMKNKIFTAQPYNIFFLMSCLLKPFFKRNYFIQDLKKDFLIFINAYPDSIINESDLIVVPEMYGKNINRIGKGIKKVIFNQNAHYTFRGYSILDNNFQSPYLNQDVIWVLAISEQNYDYLKYIFPKINIKRLPYGINSKLFSYGENKKEQIAFMPRKLSNQIEQVINILKARNALDNFELVAIENKTEEETANILKESIFFLSFSTLEGYGLPPQEAMACGCVVIGYDGGGGKEYFNKDFCYPVTAEDILGFAKTVEQIIKEYKENKKRILEKGKMASESILQKYSISREENEVVSFWKEIFKQAELINNKWQNRDCPVLEDFSQFSGISLQEIIKYIDNYANLTNREWDELYGNFSNKALKFYGKSKFYIYDLFASNYNKNVVIEKLNKFNPEILNSIREHSGTKFLEFGGGTGIFCEITYEMGKEITYLDIPGLVSEFAQWRLKKYKIPFNCIITDPADQLKLNDDYDIIFTDAVLEHTIYPNQIVNELCSHLKTNGLLILLIDLRGHSDKYHMHRNIKIKKLHKIIRNAGLINKTGNNCFCSIWTKK